MKTMNKMMTNGEIYSYAVGMTNTFNDNESYMPAAIAYSIQKNKTTLIEIAEDVEKRRLDIIQHYAIEQDGESFKIDPSEVNAANKELNDLLNIQQELKIYTFRIDEISDVKLTSAQMQSLMFMVDDEESVN